jgi:hypothetical protein
VTGALTATVANPIAAGAPFDLKLQLAVVAPGGTPPTGSVTFKVGAVVLGSAAVDGSGLATLANVTLSPAKHYVVRAFYAGDADTLAFASAGLVLIVV